MFLPLLHHTNSSKSLKLGGICSYVIVNVLMVLYDWWLFLLHGNITPIISVHYLP